jgi:hypothetical protein
MTKIINGIRHKYCTHCKTWKVEDCVDNKTCLHCYKKLNSPNV